MNARLAIMSVAIGVIALASAAAEEAERLTANAREADENVKISLKAADGSAPEATASVAGGVLQVRFASPVQMDASALMKEAPRTIAAARLDTGGRVLRVSLRRPLSASLSANGGEHIVTLSPANQVEGVVAKSTLERGVNDAEASINVATKKNLTRLSVAFRGTPAQVRAVKAGERIELRFSRALDLDFAALRVSPPQYVKRVERLSQPGQRLVLGLSVEPTINARSFVEGGRAIIDLFPAPAQPPNDAQKSAASTPSYAPLIGVANVTVTDGPQSTTITVSGTGNAAAAAFRRGEHVWILFGGDATLNLSGARRAGRRFGVLEPIRAAGVTGLRASVTSETQIAAKKTEQGWSFEIGPRYQRGAYAAYRRDVDPDGRGVIVIAAGRAGSAHRVRDPSSGEDFTAIVYAGAQQGFEERRATQDAVLLATAQGAMIESRVDDLDIVFNGADVRIRRRSDTLLVGDGPVEAAPAAAKDDDTQSDSFEAMRDNLRRLEHAAALEGVAQGAPVTARLALATYQIEAGLAAEALGTLRVAQVNQPQLEFDPDFRLLRASANVMMTRFKEADADLALADLADNAEAALWRGFVSAERGRWPESRRELTRGRSALGKLSPAWQARMHLAAARAAMALDDVAAAAASAQEALRLDGGGETGLFARIIQARAAQARGDTKAALAVLDDVSTASFEAPAVAALFEATRLRRKTGETTPEQAAEALEALRYRWRGDSIEVNVVQTLGQVYAEAGRWRDGLGVMRYAVNRYALNPIARDMRAEMADMFGELFLEGAADTLDPVQALGLFYDFQELTPVGADGDRMVRALAGRLVKLDLMEQAAQLLQHQVEERLEGIGRAQIAADLANIYLSDRKPERALAAIELTRQPNMPRELLEQRRILEAKALLDLGRSEHAVELLERDRGAPAQRVRAEAAWRERDWPRAAAELRQVLAGAPRTAPADDDTRSIAMRAAIAMTFAEDAQGLAGLRRTWLGQMAPTPNGDAFDIITAGLDTDGATVRDVARSIARTDILDRFLETMRAQMPGAQAASATQNAAPPPA